MLTSSGRNEWVGLCVGARSTFDKNNTQVPTSSFNVSVGNMTSQNIAVALPTESFFLRLACRSRYVDGCTLWYLALKVV